MSQDDEQSKAAGVSLREAAASDDEFLFALYGSTRRDELTAWGMPEAQQEMFLRLQYRAQQQRHMAERDHSRHDIILRGGVPVGRMIVVRSADEMRLADIALLPSERGGGIGSARSRELQAEAARLAVPLRLHVARDNAGAARLYERLGFAVRGDNRRPFQIRMGE